jgi:phospholipid/cholesterol/gamma-HCH transport system substrate-binding protein
MKRDTINYFSVGLFVLAGLALLLYAMYHLVSGIGDRDTYYTRYRNVAGLSAGTLVTYEGYSIGHITAIEPERTAQGLEYRVEMRVQKGWRMPSDSTARIYANGLLADFVLDIIEGQSTAFLEPGATLESRQGGDLFATLGTLAGEFGELSEQGLRPLLDTLNRSVGSVGGELESRLPVILDGTQRLVEKLDASATHLSAILNADTEAQTRRVLRNVDHAAADLRTLGTGLTDISEQTQQLLGKLDALVTTSQPDLRQAVSDLRRTLQQVSRYSDSILQNLDSTARHASEFSRQIRENPGRLLSGSPPSDPGGRRE